ncbi:MAG: CarD family transcriptional regulator [Actinobacteria bacterium RBG_19FT_COMBO_54_7]|uniref:CarD family transcriptional regulator n=1 Tax=Candidatus Solincola sediminis TaxID=1797199 RepID=A0A1F2WF59_9ACTN|nr:MAG: CarD family transcriptional regulator [Candidatus Solincola sediminis]OFW57832.1 MAG: CarD family transcriptional regulator [Candidatus Solincola sediminis]OFW68572.1 MAG: CarD family transcriptional regulator [Actinobacteria bacterium RBG_19FT_COMBO_54_7]
MRVFDVGDVVVYPHHGAGLIEGIIKKCVDGEDVIYFVLRMCQGNLKVMVPADNSIQVGLRNVIGKDEVDRVFDVLGEDQTPMPTNWNHRYKKNRDKLRSGDVFQVAEVVRNLTLRDMEKGLSSGEKRMLNQARDILASELMYAVDVEASEALHMIEEVFSTSV